MFMEELFGGNIIIMIIVFATSVAITYYFTRWVFSINQTLRNQERIIALLEKLTEQPIAAKKTEEKPRTELEELKYLYDRNNITLDEYEKAKDELKSKR